MEAKAAKAVPSARQSTTFAEKRVDGRTVRVTLGIHGQITAARARDLAQEKLGGRRGLHSQQREGFAHFPM